MSNELAEKINQFQKESQEKGARIVIDCIVKYLEKYPSVNNISWNQFTPYFNDGEECEFNVNTEFLINGIDEYDEEDFEEGENSDYDERVKLHRELAEAFSHIEDSVFQFIFGDHKQITIDRNGKINIEEYEHE